MAECVPPAPVPAPGPAIDEAGPTSHFFVSQRLRLHYLDWGNPTAPLLILQHGGMDHAHSWDRVARALRHDWHVIAPDLRGHGDSDWSPDAAYLTLFYTCDMAQLIDQLGARQVTIVGHSLGGHVALRYAGLFPERVARLVAIEGLGLAPHLSEKRAAMPVADRWRDWIVKRRAVIGRTPRRYADIDAAVARMHGEHKRLSEAQARHLTTYGLRRNEDGSWSWKYDNHLHAMPPDDVAPDQMIDLWQRVTCPVLLAWGAESWASNPATDGRAAHFRDARVAAFADAGHWLHHDRYAEFMAELRGFLDMSG